MAKVNFRSVSKSFGSVDVIRAVDIDIDDGEFVVFVGPSGCGKTTLLRMLAGLEDISAGTIFIGDEPVNHLPPRERDIAMVFQSYALYPHMTVEENIAFPLRMQRYPVAERRKPARDVAELLGLSPYLDRYPRELSGGQRQRVAMGRAIIRDPAVFLFDEPLSNLDAKLRVQMRLEVKQLHQRLGTTMIYVTHDQVEAMTMADKIVVLRDGKIEQVGSPREIYDHPASIFVGEFIGSPSMNIIRGAFSRHQDATLCTANGLRIPVPALPPRAGRTGPTAVGIRPEHLAIVPPDNCGAIVGDVAMVETTGSETSVVVSATGTMLTASTRQNLTYRQGQRIGLKPMTEHLHLFFENDEAI